MKKKALNIFLLMCCLMQVQCQIINSTGLLSGCGKTKGCYTQPPGCSGDCKLVATWTTDQGNNVTFELVGNSNGWVAVGFNDKSEMAGGEALVCLNADVRHYSLPGHSASPTGKTGGLEYLSGSNINGYLRCRFTRVKNPGKGMKDLTQEWYMIFAIGPMGSSDIEEHYPHSKYATSHKVDLSLAQEVDSGRTVIDVLIKAHGCVMCIAWLGFAIIGMFFARYMKTAFGEELVLGLKAWFQFHRSLMLLTVLLTIVGGILIFQEQKWEMEGDLHPVIGLIVIILACLQPLFALLRPGPNHQKRWVFNWAHRAVGLLTLILAVVAIFLGINLDEMNLGAAQNAIIAVYLSLAVLLAVGVEVYDYLLLQNKHQKRVVEYDQDSELKMDHGQDKENSKNRNLHKLVLMVLSVLSTVAVLASVIFIATAEPGEGGDESDSDEE